jgi:hypothetical protein
MHDLPDELAEPATASLLSRRTFFAGAAAVVGTATVTLVSVPSAGAAARPESSAAPTMPAVGRAPVVGFYMERPYLDMTGTAEPYVPPAGLRSGQAMAGLSEAEWLSRHPYLF